jgi:hypothetical protein
MTAAAIPIADYQSRLLKSRPESDMAIPER